MTNKREQLQKLMSQAELSELAMIAHYLGINTDELKDMLIEILLDSDHDSLTNELAQCGYELDNADD